MDIASTGVFRRAVTRICPNCVVEARTQGLHAGPYQLLEWLFLSIQTCTRHGVPLITLPNTSYAHDTYDLLAQVERHQTAIRQSIQITTGSSLTPFETYMTGRIRGHVEHNWLRSLDLQHVHRGCLTLGSALLFGAGTNSAGLNDPDRKAAMAKGYAVLRAGPTSLTKALARLKAAYKSERPDFSTDMGDFYAWLKEESDEQSLAPFRDAVRDYIAGYYPVRVGQLILGKKLGNAVRMTFGDARQVAGIARGRMLVTLGHLRRDPTMLGKPIIDVSSVDIQAVHSFWAGRSNLKDTATALNVHPSQIKKLIERGVLDAMRLGSALRYVTKTSIEQTLQAIYKLPVGDKNPNLLPIAGFSQHRGIPMAFVLKSVLTGEIVGAFRSEAESGIKSVLIDHKEMPPRQRRRHAIDMSIEEAARHLQIGQAAIRELRDCG